MVPYQCKKECIRTNLGSSKMSKETAQVVKERAPGPMAKVLNFFDILLFVFLIPFGFFLMDLVTDALLVSDYFSEMNNATAAAAHDVAMVECQRNLTLSCYSKAMSARSKFSVSVAIVLFPFAFYLVEVAKYFRCCVVLTTRSFYVSSCYNYAQLPAFQIERY